MADHYPELLDYYVDVKGKSIEKAKFSVMSAVFEDMEQTVLRVLVWRGQQRASLQGLEHDGSVFQLRRRASSGELLEHCQQGVDAIGWDIKLHLKPMQTNLRDALLSRWPGEDFTEVGFAPGYSEGMFLSDYATCLRSITPAEKDEHGKPLKGADGRGTGTKARAVSAAFARFLTCAMAGSWLKTPSGDLFAWQVHESTWKQFKDATTIIESEVRLQFGILHHRREFGKLVLPQPAAACRLAEPLDDETFLTQLAKACERRAPVTEDQLDGRHMRYKFVFAGGELYDFNENRVRPVRPSDMLSRHCPWRYRAAPWGDEVDSDLKNVFVKIANHFAAGHDLNGAESSEDPVVLNLVQELNLGYNVYVWVL
jgi:hypothetical protein